MSELKQILLVARRDEPLGGLISEVLMKEGFDLAIAETFEETFAELNNKKYDLILPTNNSLHYSVIPGLVSEIKVRYPNINIIVLSGYCDPIYVLSLKQQGIDDFLKMPFKFEDLLSKIQRSLSKKKII